jgi:hypothetical protein
VTHDAGARLSHTIGIIQDTTARSKRAKRRSASETTSCGRRRSWRRSGSSPQPRRGGSLLQKPFTVEALDRKVREVLDESNTDAYQVPIMHTGG